jgi:hypothetical protein
MLLQPLRLGLAPASDHLGQRLHFLCDVLCAVFPLHPSNEVGLGDITESLRYFKEFFVSHQPELSRENEFLPYSVLRYIPNSNEHPSFQPLLSDDSFHELRRRLSE